MNYGSRSLADLYGKVAGKEVPPRKHLRVLGEDDQLALPMGGEGVEGKPVLKKHLPPGYEKGDVHVAEDPLTSEKIGGMLLGLGGAPKSGGDKNAVNNVIQYVRDLLKRYGGEGLEKDIISILSSLYENQVVEKLPHEKRFNWVEFVKSHHASVAKGRIDSEFIVQLSKLQGSGSVNIGNPEFAGVVFLTDTTKANVGDIQRGGVTYEVKAQDARIR